MYKLTDQYFGFWYSFGYANLSELENDEAADKSESKYILGECKFRTELIDKGELRNLQEKLIFGEETYYYLFSLSGFTDAVTEASESEGNLFLVDAKQSTEL